MCIHRFVSDNRCDGCGVIGIYEEGEPPSYPQIIRSTSKMIPGAQHPYPFVGNLTRVWVGWFATKKDYWVRIAFADATGKTYERDRMDLTWQGAEDVYDHLLRQIGGLGVEPELSQLLSIGYSFG